ncbi:RNA polymerase sigma-70 factor (ECF subfamily) [Nocardiopsis arvandica]|uniref:RNA polymerase sigma-70 factor (ECF subfamily) n=1 Tax=Nocardiopsis sinuspersici TaxID=501010 RepID=A0A7Z0BK20_9ACTN|nr:RNA polymerase sigma factor [Nocardiopsis sinuspersici]NYH52680.1 RNA polymerase sigma-70 factor (ECF subfamily) [Nocardiopsis sinuspersici]
MNSDTDPGSTDTDPEGSSKGEFTRFFERHYDDVYRYAVRRMGADCADDVAAETFGVAWRRYGRLPKDQPLPWLYGVARNVVRARRRHDRRHGEVLVHEGGDRGPKAPDTVHQVEERDTALRALDRLSATDRELVMLLAWEGLELRDAARVLGCTTATARVRLHRARRRIERFLDSSPPEPPLPAGARPAETRRSPAHVRVTVEKK